MTHRILVSLIFIVAGYGHIFETSQIVNRMENIPVTNFFEGILSLELLALLTGFILLLGGLTLFFGLYTKLSSFLLLIVLIPITLVVQTQGAETLGPLFKNIALIGALIYFIAVGSLGFSIDSLITKRVSHE